MVTRARSIVLLLLLYSLHGVPDTYGQGNGAVRLYRSGGSSLDYTRGLVQVYYDRSWGSVCMSDGTWSQIESDVVCHQLGWDGAMSYGPAADAGYGTDGIAPVLDEVQCSSGEYLVLLQCIYSTDIRNTCNDNSDVTVDCYTTRLWDALEYMYEGAVRLTGGHYVTEGLVEVYCNGQWGTVCDDAFGPLEAGSICTQLGYTTAMRYDHLIIPGNASQPIWLDNVVCEQIEGCIATCQSCPLGRGHECRHDDDIVGCCRHAEDVTVECSTSTNESYDNDVITTTCESANNRPTEPELLSLGAIVGVVVGCVILLFISMVIPIVICCCCRGQYRASGEPGETQERPVTSATNPTLSTPTSLVTPTINSLPEVVIMDNSPTITRRNMLYQHPGPSSNVYQSHAQQGPLDRTPRHLPLSNTNSAPYDKHVTTPPAYEEPTVL